MVAVHILIFGEMGSSSVHSNTQEKSSKVCNIKVCNMKKYCILSSSANYMGTISKYIIKTITVTINNDYNMIIRTNIAVEKKNRIAIIDHKFDKQSLFLR